MKIKANKILAVLCVIAMIMTMIVPMTLTAAAVADEYSYTFTAKQFTANGSKALNDVTWTAAGDGNYWGYDGTKGQQFGSGGDPYKSLTLTSDNSFDSRNVTKIVINTSGAKSIAGTLTVTVGGTQIGNQITLTNTATSYTFETDTPLSGTIVLNYTQTSSKAIYIKSIAISSYAGSCVHEWDEGEVTVVADCTNDGEMTYTCTKCDDTKTEVISATGHDWDEGEIVTEADCTNAGEITYTCNNCEDTMSEVIPATGHNWDGTTCTECGEEISEGTEIVFDFGANKDTLHVDGSTAETTYSETSGPYTLNLTGMDKAYPASYDNVGNSALKFGTGSAAGKFSLTVPNSIAKVIINVAGYKANTAKITVNGTAYTINTLSNDGEYTAIEVDTSTTKTVTFTTVSGGYRCMVDSIIFVVGGDCAHLNKSNVVNTATCTEGGIYSYVCDDCGYEHSEEIPATGHNFVDKVCTVCGASEYPEMTIDEVIASANGTKATLKDVVIVSIDEEYSEQYGNITVTVEDASGSRIKLFRLVGNFDLGATITAQGVYKLYNSTPELDAGCTAVVTKPAPVTEIAQMSVNAGADLSLLARITLAYGEDIANYSVKFTSNGAEEIVTVFVEKDGKYVFALDKLAPQTMADLITIELLKDGEVVDTLADYSIKAYAETILQGEYSDELKILVTEMLSYGETAQKYLNYNMNNLATAGLDTLLVYGDANRADFVDEKSAVQNADKIEGVSITALGVQFDCTNKIYAKFTADNLDGITATVDGNNAEIIALGGNTYAVYTDAILATGFGTYHTIVLNNGGEAYQTVTYSVNSFAKTNADLGDALYNYGVAAVNYMATLNA